MADPPPLSPQPPVPFADFEFSFDPPLHPLFPPLPAVPSSASLFSHSETTDLFGFLDNFAWEFDPEPLPFHAAPPPYSNPHLGTAPSPSTSRRHAAHASPSDHSSPRSSSRLLARARSRGPPETADPSLLSSSSAAPALLSLSEPQPDSPSPSADGSKPSVGPGLAESPSAASRASKTLLSQPQKRLNHIMSEQKRRNAIRDGYAQLTTLLAPAGAPPGAGMPTRGRPKGSGNHGKGHGKGKSGILFRAVEYCHFLEEGRDALLAEVQRVEATAGIPPG